MAKPIFTCGALILMVLVTLARLDARAEPVWFLGLMGLAAGAYVVALWFIARRPGGSRRELAICVLLALAWRIALMSGAPLVSDDVYRYVWDGRVQRFGLNPYETTPADPALAHLHTEVTRRIDPTSAALPAIYPPAAELFFRAVTTVHESVTALLLAIVVCDLLTAFVLWRWLLVTGHDPWWVLAYVWHPLVALEGAGGGHIDLLGALFVVTSAYTATRRRTLSAAVTLAVAFAVKFLPVVLAPLLWRRVRVRDTLLAAGAVALLYVPFLTGGLTLPVGSLGVYTEKWRFNGPLFAWLEPWLGIPGVLVLAVAAGLCVAGVARQRLPVDATSAWAWPMATTLLLIPAVYPWYLIWLTPFLTTGGTRPLLVWTLASMLTYIVWASELGGAGWVLPGWVEPIEYGAVAATGLWVWHAGSSASPDVS